MVALRASLLTALLAGACAGAEPRAALAAGAAWPELEPIRARELIVTSGQLEPATGSRLEHRSGAPAAGGSAEPLSIRSPTLRAWVGREPRSAVELEFIYLGPSALAAPLGSGELRRQIGLELRARDSCNLLYVMWRIEPVPRLMVSLKSNPAQHQHSECADRGYQNLEPESAGPLPPLRLGERHVLGATLVQGAAGSGAELQVSVDGVGCWRGALPPAALALQGPVGLRSDNGQFDVRLRAGSSKR